jgi:hypothetical protein
VTVDIKPHGLALQTARPRSRRVPGNPKEDETATGVPHGCHYQAPPTMNPQYYYPPQPAPIMPEIDSRHVEFPDIISWCKYLDSHTGRNRDGIQFTPFGEILKDKGFVRLSLIDNQLFSPQDLAGWLDLGTRVGTAIQIMQYAKQDIDAIKTGRLFIPPQIPN